MTLSREDQLLLSCARVEIGDEDICHIQRLVAGPVNWDLLLRRSAAHGITPLLFHNGKRVNSFPGAVMDTLRQIYYANARRNLRLGEHLKRVLAAFQRAGIDVMVLKGIALAEMTYRNLALRPIGDIDLLVHEEEFDGISRMLLSLGYFPNHPLPRLSPSEIVSYAHHCQQLRFWSRDGQLVETHFRLLNLGPPRGDEAGVWKRAVSVEVLGLKSLVPSPDDYLLHLCIHANQHNYCMIRFFSDIAEHIKNHRQEIDWEAFVNRTRRRRLNTSVYYTLTLAHQLLGTELPREIMMKLQPCYVRGKLFERVWNTRKVLQLKKAGRPNEFEAPLYYLWEMDGIREKVTYLLTILFPPRQWLSGLPSSRKTSNPRVRHVATLLSKACNVGRRHHEE